MELTLKFTEIDSQQELNNEHLETLVLHWSIHRKMIDHSIND